MGKCRLPVHLEHLLHSYCYCLCLNLLSIWCLYCSWALWQFPSTSSLLKAIVEPFVWYCFQICFWESWQKGSCEWFSGLMSSCYGILWWSWKRYKGISCHSVILYFILFFSPEAFLAEVKLDLPIAAVSVKIMLASAVEVIQFSWW